MGYRFSSGCAPQPANNVTTRFAARMNASVRFERAISNMCGLLKNESRDRGGRNLPEGELHKQAPRPPLPSVVETVANLYKDFARIQVVRPAESKTIVEEDASIGDIDRLYICGEPFAEALAQRKVKRSVRLEMITRDRGIAIGEAGGVINVCRGVGMEGEIVARAEMQCVALVMIEEVESVTKGRVREAAIDISKGESELVRVG